MLYGHVETPSERITHLIKLRDLQSESLTHAGLDPHTAPTQSSALSPQSSAYFNCCIPLSFIPEHSELATLPGPTALTDLTALALLMLHHNPHIKAFWIMQVICRSQLSFSYAVDDFDGPVVWYDITKRQGHGTHQELHEHDLKRLIREAGRTPVERDTLYNPL